MLYPINLELAGRKCVIVGGGEVAERKARTLLTAEAGVTVIAPKLTKGLTELAEAGQVDWYEMEFFGGMLKEIRPLLVFCATDEPAVNEQAAEEARSIGALVNAATEQELTDFTVPASVRRENFLVTVSTGGVSPGLSRALRQELEREFPEAFGEWLERLAVLRQEVKEILADSRARQVFWREALSVCVLNLVRNGKLSQAEAEIRNAIHDVGAQSQNSAG